MGRCNGWMGVMIRLLTRRGRVFRAFFFFIDYFPCPFISAFSSSSLGRQSLQLTNSLTHFMDGYRPPCNSKHVMHVVVHRPVVNSHSFILAFLLLDSFNDTFDIFDSSHSISPRTFGPREPCLPSANEIDENPQKLEAQT